MDTVKNLAFIAALLLVVVFSCKEKEFDSPNIIIDSPSKGESVSGKDSVKIRFKIKPNTSGLASWDVVVQNKKGDDIYFSTANCDCDGDTLLAYVERNFVYAVKKKTDAVMTACVKFRDGTQACETVRFAITE